MFRVIFLFFNPAFCWEFIKSVMAHYILKMYDTDLENESEELGLIMDEVSDDEDQELKFVLALVVLTVVAGTVLLGIGLALNIFFGV